MRSHGSFLTFASLQGLPVTNQLLFLICVQEDWEFPAESSAISLPSNRDFQVRGVTDGYMMWSKHFFLSLVWFQDSYGVANMIGSVVTLEFIQVNAIYFSSCVYCNPNGFRKIHIFIDRTLQLYYLYWCNMLAVVCVPLSLSWATCHATARAHLCTIICRLLQHTENFTETAKLIFLDNC